MKVIGIASLALVAAASVDAQLLGAPVMDPHAGHDHSSGSHSVSMTATPARTYSTTSGVTRVAGATAAAVPTRTYSTSTSGLSTVSRPFGDSHSVLGHTDVYRTGSTITSGLSTATTLPARTYSTSTSGLSTVSRPFGDRHSALGHTDVYRTGYTTGSVVRPSTTSWSTGTYRPSSLSSKYQMVPAEPMDATIVDSTPDEVKKGRAMSPPTPAPLGSNKCTQGPSYWCASEANAKACGLNYATTCPKYQTKPPTSAPLMGSNKCTWGPSYWCESEANMKECGMTSAECAKYTDSSSSSSSSTSSYSPADCAKGASFFCASEEQAKYCNYDFAKCAVYYDEDFKPIPQTGTTLATTSGSTIATTRPTTTYTTARVGSVSSGLTAVSKPLGDSHSMLSHTDVYRTTGSTIATTRPATTYTTARVGGVSSGLTAVSKPLGDSHSMLSHTDVYRTPTSYSTSAVSYGAYDSHAGHDHSG